LSELDEGVIDDAWLAKKPKWERYRSHPVSFAMVWRRQSVLTRQALAQPAKLP
jgi:hypothetical protein